MTPAAKQKLREEFLGPRTVGEIAKRTGLNWRRVNRFWKAEKAAGRLPEVRPHFLDRCKRVVAEAAAIVEANDDAEAPSIDKNAAPIADPNPSYVAQCDAFAAALARANGQSWRRLQDMPAHTLEIELKYPPSAERVRELARTADVYTAALIARGVA